MSDRHTEFFGPNLAGGPFSTHRIETAVVQIATAIAQLRAPLGRGENDLLAHADLIRQLADRLAPDFAAQISMDVGTEASDQIQTTIRTALDTFSLLDCWLADSVGGGETGTSPTSVTWNTGVVLQTITANKRYLVITPSTGVAAATVQYGGAHTWYWAVTRYARVFYSSQVRFL